MDWRALRDQVEFLIAGGARVLLQTWGDSMHMLLSEAEVAELTRVLVEQAKGRALVVAADNEWNTQQTAAFAAYCRETGADILMVRPPDWAGALTPERLIEHCNAIGEHMPLMIVTAFLEYTYRGKEGWIEGQPMSLMQAMYDSVPSMIAVKDDVCGDFGNALCETVCARWSFFSGGLTLNHYPQYAHGADGYLCGFMSFKPELGLRYWKALNEGDGATVRQVMDIERRLWRHIETYDGGFNAVFRGIMELFGVAPRYIRKPFHTMTDEQMERLKTYLSENGLGP